MNTVLAEYVEQRRDAFFDESEVEFNTIMKLVGQFRTMSHHTRLLEIGPGLGWFQIRCQRQGIPCSGLEIDARLAASAVELGRQYGIVPDIQIGSIESGDIGTSQYDVVVATSTFEHVKDWRRGLENIANALKDDGLLYFASTNKFSLRSGEYWIPLYGWLPDGVRYWLRRKFQGDDIMEWGIDFNQFTYPQLRRCFHEIGFSKVFDLADVLDPENLNHPTALKRVVLRAVKRIPVFRQLFLTFSRETLFVCVK